MSSAFIRDLAALEGLQLSIKRFCLNRDALLQADRIIESTLDQLRNREGSFLSEISARSDELREARAHLSECESSSRRESAGGAEGDECSSQRDYVEECGDHVNDASEKYSLFKSKLRWLEGKVATYQSFRSHFDRHLESHVVATIPALGQLVGGALDYMNVVPVADVIGSRSQLPNGQQPTSARGKYDQPNSSIENERLRLVSRVQIVGKTGQTYQVRNMQEGRLVRSSIEHTVGEDLCARMQIDSSGPVKVARIGNVTLPQILRAEELHGSVIKNLECIARAHDCDEITVWASPALVPLYIDCGFGLRGTLGANGAELCKVLPGRYWVNQAAAHGAFFGPMSGTTHSGPSVFQHVDPLMIQTPKEVDTESFWGQHSETADRYVELVQQVSRCEKQMDAGLSLDKIRSTDSWAANAYDIFRGSEPIQLRQIGPYFQVVAGRHRVAAAQLHYLRTGEVLQLWASVSKEGEGGQ